MARKKRSGYCISLTDVEKLRADRVLELEGRNRRQQFMVMIDAALAKLDPDFLKDSKAREE